MLLLRRPGDNEDASSCCNRRGAKLIVHSPTPQLLFAQHIMLLPSLRFVKADELLCSQLFAGSGSSRGEDATGLFFKEPAKYILKELRERNQQRQSCGI